MPAVVIAIPATSAPRSGRRSDARPASALTTKDTIASGAEHEPGLDRVAALHVEQEQRHVDERAERAAGEQGDPPAWRR